MRIDLSYIEGNRYKVLSGADFGERVRKIFRLDEMDKNGDVITIYVPEYVYSLNSSFFSGLFQKSITTLGEKKFREKYQFECSDIIKENIEDGIFNIVYTLNLLGRE